MSDTREELRHEIAMAMEPDLRQAGPDHPQLDELVAYQLGQLSEKQASDLQEHLSACPECTDLMLDLETFVTAGGASAQPTISFEAAANWRSLRDRLRKPTGRSVWLVAASVAALLASLTSWALFEKRAASELRVELAQLYLPQPDVPIVDLYPESAQRGPSDAPRPVAILPGALYLTVVLAVPDPPEASRFEAEIQDSGGFAVWKGAVRISEHGTVRLGLPTRLIDDGDLSIHLLAIDGETRKRIETYSLSVVSSADGSDDE